MTNGNGSISLWIRAFDNGAFDLGDFKTQCEAGWYDWFCKEDSLRNKTYKLAPKVKRIAKLLGQKFCDTHYVFFKNNCPMQGSLYDDFRFCDRKTGDVVYTIIPSSGFDSKKGQAELWGKDNNFNEPLVQGSWSDVVNFFKTKK